MSILALASFYGTVSAQSARINVDKNLVYRQPVEPEYMDNYLFSMYYSNRKSAYNLKGFKMGQLRGNVISLKINPAGYSYAALSGNGRKGAVEVRDINGGGDGAVLPGLKNPSAICYTSDSRTLIVADSGNLVFYDTKSLAVLRSFAVDGVPSLIEASHNGYFVAAAMPDRVDVINQGTGEVRASFRYDETPVDVKFTDSGGLMGVLLGNGELHTYSTADFSPVSVCGGMGEKAYSLSFHPEENYAAVSADGSRIQFVNLINPSDRPSLYEPDGNVFFSRFLRDGSGNLYIAYNTSDAVKYKRISGFTPNYSKTLTDMLNERMREWSKMRDGETEEMYRERVNEETTARQRKLFANEIATSLAGDLIDMNSITLGRYNPETGMLTVNMGNLPSIYLTVPQEDMASFGSGGNLQFSNAVYGLRADNTFELIYVDVYNPDNGKRYSFDNLERQNLDFLLTDDRFVSLDLIRQSTMEDVVLQGIKKQIIDEARSSSIISEHTNIDVATAVEPSVDAYGNRINNYRVDFTYTVDAGYSAKEDFAPGRYLVEDSPAAASMLRIISQAFRNEFASYIVPGKALSVEITGSADATPINRGIAYDGVFGEISNEPCRVDGDLTTISVDSGTGIRTNEQLAFIRAQAVRHSLASALPEISAMSADWKYNVKVTKEKGSEYRRISVSLVFIDAF